MCDGGKGDGFGAGVWFLRGLIDSVVLERMSPGVYGE